MTSTPIATTKTGVKTVLEGVITDITFYDEQPIGGQPPESCLIREVQGDTYASAIGDRTDGEVSTMWVTVRLEFNVFSQTKAVANTTADKILDVLKDNKSTLKGTYDIYNYKGVMIRELAKDDPHERHAFRKRIRIDFTVLHT